MTGSPEIGKKSNQREAVRRASLNQFRGIQRLLPRIRFRIANDAFRLEVEIEYVVIATHPWIRLAAAEQNDVVCRVRWRKWFVS